MSRLRLSAEALGGTPPASTVELWGNAYKRLEQIDPTGKHLGLVNPYTVNVLDFGAVGDGVTDDTAAIKAARDYAVANFATFGWSMFFPAGRYLVSSVIAFASTQISIHGSGSGESQIWTTAYTAGDIFTFGAQSQVNIYDLGIWANTPRTSGAAIAFNGTSSSRCSRLIIWNQFKAITCTTPSQLMWFDNIELNGSTAASCVGIEINSPTFGDFYIDHIVFNNTNSGGAGLQVGTGINILASLMTMISNADLVGWKNAIVIAPGAGAAVTWTFMSNVLCDTCSDTGLLLSAPTATSTIRGVFLNNCWMATNNQSATPTGHGGVELNSAAVGGIIEDVSFERCQIINNGAHGIITIGTGAATINELRVLGCTIMGNGTKATNTYDGIQIAAGIKNITITNNRIGGSLLAFLVQQRYGVNILAGGTDNYIIKNNNIFGNTTANNTAAVFDGGTGVNKDTTPNIGTNGEMALATKNSAASLFATEAIVVGPAPLWGKEVLVGSMFRISFSGIATFTLGGTMIFKLRAGTLGTTSDAVFFTAPTLTTAVGTAIPYKGTIDFMVTAVGANNTILATFALWSGNTGSVTGIANVAQTLSAGTPATFPNTVTLMELTALGATSTGAGITCQGTIEQVR